MSGYTDGHDRPVQPDLRSFSLLYMGNPIGIHIEMLLNKNGFFENGFCERMSKTFLRNYINSKTKVTHHSSSSI